MLTAPVANNADLIEQVKSTAVEFDYLYEKTQIDEWVPKVEDASKNVKKVYGYFNNHFHGYAPENCLYLIERLGLLSEEQKTMGDIEFLFASSL